MQTKFIVTIAVALLVVIFSMQNLETASVDLWFWEAESSIAVIVIFSFGLGALASAAFSLPSLMAKNKAIRKLQKQIKQAGLPIEKKEPDDPDPKPEKGEDHHWGDQ